MSSFLTWAIVIYFMIGLSITAFCVHMSYHEAAVGFHDNDDVQAQKVLESRMGPIGFIFLFTFWPLALLIAFLGKGKPGEAEAPPTQPAAPAEKHG
ncbi:MAG TPA: hypothetical protein VEK08_05565 [Planctomycetota bacterium]|nr:hypothetical protein [Planctomycetota bacterium]